MQSGAWSAIHEKPFCRDLMASWKAWRSHTEHSLDLRNRLAWIQPALQQRGLAAAWRRWRQEASDGPHRRVLAATAVARMRNLYLSKCWQASSYDPLLLILHPGALLILHCKLLFPCGLRISSSACLMFFLTNERVSGSHHNFPPSLPPFFVPILSLGRNLKRSILMRRRGLQQPQRDRREGQGPVPPSPG